MKELIKLLRLNNETVSVMESCTGGGIANAITNIENASDVISFGVVTYSNEAKIKMGVNKEIIDKYSVYSIEVAEEMSKNICLFANSEYGIGVTGKLGKEDKKNPSNDNNTVYISVYSQKDNSFNNKVMKVTGQNRSENKEIVIAEVVNLLERKIKKYDE